MSWRYLTLERTKMNTWTRKRRLKFRKRWRKQHHGQNFRWFKTEFVALPIMGTYPEYETMILHVRE